MPIAVKCTQCGGKMQAPDNLAGKKVKCPKCAHVMVLPAGDDGSEAIQTAAPAPAPPRASTEPPAPPRRRPERDDPDQRDDDADDDYDVGRRVRTSQGGGNNGLAIAGMVLGIIGFLVAFVPCFGWVIAIVLGIIGATLSGIGLATASKQGGGKGMAIAGLVLSILGIIWGPAYFFIIVGTAVNQAANQLEQAVKNNPQVFVKDKGFVFQPGGPLQGPPTPVSGKVTLNNGQATLQGNLGANDPKDRARQLSVCKVFTINMAAGKTYQIDMMQANDGLDPYLRLEDAAGNQVAQNDDGGDNLNARILFTCMNAGEYRIVATTFVGGTGNFTLQVSEK